jgi:acyl carrier protein
MLLWDRVGELDRHASFFRGKFEMTTDGIDVPERVYEILREYLGSDVSISPESKLLDDLGMDSLEQVELGLKLERDFNIKILVAELRSCVTLEEVIQLVQQRVASQEEGSSA